MASSRATLAAKKELAALSEAEEKIEKSAPKAKVYKSRGQKGEDFVRVTIFASAGSYNYRGGKNNSVGGWIKSQLDNWLNQRYLADYVMTETSISEEDFNIAFEGA